MMKFVILLRGVTPTGKNKIPKMSYLVEILKEVGFESVSTYIQSGNIVLKTELFKEDTAELIHKTIFEKIGADLKVIVKDVEQLKLSLDDNPFDNDYDLSRIHLVFTNDRIDSAKLKEIEDTDFGEEKFVSTNECLYMYLPKNSGRNKLYTNYLEKKLGISATTRKLNVISKLVDIAENIKGENKNRTYNFKD